MLNYKDNTAEQQARQQTSEWNFHIQETVRRTSKCNLKWDQMKPQGFCTAKETIDRWTESLQNEGNSLQPHSTQEVIF